MRGASNKELLFVWAFSCWKSVSYVWVEKGRGVKTTLEMDGHLDGLILFHTSFTL